MVDVVVVVVGSVVVVGVVVLVVVVMVLLVPLVALVEAVVVLVVPLQGPSLLLSPPLYFSEPSRVLFEASCFFFRFQLC